MSAHRFVDFAHRTLKKSLLYFIVLNLGIIFLAVSCGNEQRLVQLNSDGFRQDVFEQEAASRLDLLWVIDNSASMEPHQKRLAEGLDRFMKLLDRGNVDYRIAVTTTDADKNAGEFVGTPAIIAPSLANPVSAFSKNVRVGTEGSGHEEAFESARLAIEREAQNAGQILVQRTDCKNACGNTAADCLAECSEKYEPAFMRPEAHLHLIFVSDEDEQSLGELRFFQRFFETSLGVGNEGSVRAAAICGQENDTCAKASGRRYGELVQAMGGITASICDDNFGDELEAIALDAAGLKRRFALSGRALNDTITVETFYRCDTEPSWVGSCEQREDACDGKLPSDLGIRCIPPQGNTDGWTFDAKTGAVLFHGNSLPGLRSKIIISYTMDPDALSAR
jgi:hypothetical protein